MTETWLATAVPTLTLALAALLLRLQTGSWLHPAAFTALVWSIYVALPVLLVPEFLISPRAVWWIVLCVLSMCIGALMTARTRALAGATRRSRGVVSGSVAGWGFCFPAIKKLTFAGTLLAFLFPVYVALMTGWVFKTAASSPQAFAAMTHQISVNRYTPGAQVFPLSAQLLSALLFIAPGLGGILLATSRRRLDTVLALAAFLPAVLNVLVQSTRASLGYSGLLALSSYLAARVFLRQERSIGKRWRTWIPLAAVVLVATLALNGLAEHFRTGTVPYLEDLVSMTASVRTRSTFLGHLAAFSTWFDQYMSGPQPPAWGVFTLAGPANLLGLTVRAPGLFAEPVLIDEGTSQTNIYTVFRGLLEDFTPAGCILFLFAAGILGGWAYASASRSRQRAVPLLLLYYSFVLSYVSSIFVYNNVLLTLVIIGVYWQYVHPIRVRQSPYGPDSGYLRSLS